MKKYSIILGIIYFTSFAFGQITENEKMIQLASVYKDNLFIAKTPKGEIKKIHTDVPESLKTATDFIAQAITSKNKLLTPTYLNRPDDNVLKQLFVIRTMELRMRDGKLFENQKIIDSLLNTDVSTYEMMDNYYEMLFTAVGNKNQPFNFSNVDLKLDEYQLQDETEKGIVFLRCMSYCGKIIWGYMNIINPPNTSKAYKNIKLYPKVNGLSYLTYDDFNFPDFEMTIIAGEKPQSYKAYYIDKYYEILLTHLICNVTEGGSEKELVDLMGVSILKDENLYQYSTNKDVLEELYDRDVK